MNVRMFVQFCVMHVCNQCEQVKDWISHMLDDWYVIATTADEARSGLSRLLTKGFQPCRLLVLADVLVGLFDHIYDGFGGTPLFALDDTLSAREIRQGQRKWRAKAQYTGEIHKLEEFTDEILSYFDEHEAFIDTTDATDEWEPVAFVLETGLRLDFIGRVRAEAMRTLKDVEANESEEVAMVHNAATWSMRQEYLFMRTDVIMRDVV